MKKIVKRTVCCNNNQSFDIFMNDSTQNIADFVNSAITYYHFDSSTIKMCKDAWVKK